MNELTYRRVSRSDKWAMYCKAQEEIAKQQAEIDELKGKYYELLYAVANKFPDETRHQTALRYIQNAENTVDQTEQTDIKHKGA